MPYLTTPRGLRWHYEERGAGQTVLFLHGWAVNGRIWRQQMKYFGDRYRVVSVDLPGHGRSAWQSVSLTQIAQDVGVLLDSLGCSCVGIVASSFGGLVAMKLYELQQDRIRFLVLVGSQPRFAKGADYPYGLEIDRIRKLAAQLHSDYPSIVNIFFRSLFTRHERESRRFKWIQTFRKMDDVADKDALVAVLKILEREDLRDVFANIACPVYFVNGTEDPICQRSFYDDLRAKSSSVKLAWFERCGHFPFLTRPREFNEKLEGFIESEWLSS